MLQGSALAIAAVLLALKSLGTPAPTEWKPLDFLTGADSGIRVTHIELVSNSDAWKSLWNEHKGTHVFNQGGADTSPITIVDSTPDVNFKKSVVLAVFEGQMNDVTGFEVVDTKIDSRRATIRMRKVFASPLGSLQTTAYGFVMLPRPHLPIIVEFPDDEGNWKRVASYPDPGSGK